MDKYGFKDHPERILNTDEKGLNITHTQIVKHANQKAQAIISPSTDTVTIIGGGTARGCTIHPYFVFKGHHWNADLLKHTHWFCWHCNSTRMVQQSSLPAVYSVPSCQIHPWLWYLISPNVEWWEFQSYVSWYHRMGPWEESCSLCAISTHIPPASSPW